ncbi:hypothetical protein [Pseudomonas leptonychotis]|uniref:hypothetical protein n=1 Tax=Pseudomonas leptonychotis TaxID=2448482 RepID=UPI0039EE8A15
MKKIIMSVFIAASAFSSFASATSIASGTPIQAGNQGCQLLSEAVTINLSSNVHGAYTCNVANNTMRVATCHQGGSRKQATVACAVVDIVDDNGTPKNVWNDSTCTDAGAAAATPAAPHQFTSSSLGKAYSASTAGGSVAALSLGAVCTSSAPADALLQ